MDVILLEKVDNLGALGDLVAVKSGYGRNYLIPSGKAITATEKNRTAFEQRRAELEKAAGDALSAAEARRDTLQGMTITIRRKSGDEGKLFGSVGVSDIAEECTAAGVEVRKQEVRLPAGPFRQTGEYQVDLHLHPEVNTKLTVIVEGEE